MAFGGRVSEKKSNFKKIIFIFIKSNFFLVITAPYTLKSSRNIQAVLLSFCNCQFQAIVSDKFRVYNSRVDLHTPKMLNI